MPPALGVSTLRANLASMFSVRGGLSTNMGSLWEVKMTDRSLGCRHLLMGLPLQHSCCRRVL